MRVSHISRKSNIQADSLSCHLVDHAEWSLHTQIFTELYLRFRSPVVDLFASHINHQVPCFFSRFPSPGAEAVDALLVPWPQGLILYAFPPLPLIAKVLRKLLAEKGELILLAPHWPRQPWFVDFVSLSVTHPWRIPDDRICLLQGAVVHPEPQWLQLTVETEWELLTRANIPPRAIRTIQAARRTSTICIYGATWRTFSL